MLPTIFHQYGRLCWVPYFDCDKLSDFHAHEDEQVRVCVCGGGLQRVWLSQQKARPRPLNRYVSSKSKHAPGPKRVCLQAADLLLHYGSSRFGQLFLSLFGELIAVAGTHRVEVVATAAPDFCVAYPAPVLLAARACHVAASKSCKGQ